MSDAERESRDELGSEAGSDAAPPPARAPEARLGFDAQYRSLLRPPFAELADQELAAGTDGVEQARAYAERGKPDYVLAYLLSAALGDDEKRELFAHAYERRAALTEQRARQFSRQFNRPFPLLFTDAATDRAQARRIRSGRSVQRGVGRQLPTI